MFARAIFGSEREQHVCTMNCRPTRRGALKYGLGEGQYIHSNSQSTFSCLWVRCPVMQHQVLKTEGKTDEDIYAELKTLYNTSAGASSDVPVAAPSSNDDVEKPADAPDAAAAAAPEAAPPAGEATAVEVAAAPAAAPAEGETAPAVVAETPVAETPAVADAAPVEGAATAE